MTLEMQQALTRELESAVRSGDAMRVQQAHATRSKWPRRIRVLLRLLRRECRFIYRELRPW